MSLSTKAVLCRWTEPTSCSVESRLCCEAPFLRGRKGRGWDIQMIRSDSSSFSQCSVCLKLHWLLPSSTPHFIELRTKNIGR